MENGAAEQQPEQERRLAARREKIRAIRRRRILENADSRMDRVCQLQQWTTCSTAVPETTSVPQETTSVPQGTTSVADEKRVEEEETVNEVTQVEDPPDELVVLPRQPSRLPPPPPPSLLLRWKLLMQQRQRTRLSLALLLGAAASVAMGYSIPCFLFIMTSELCVLSWTLISALTARDIPQPQPLGTLAMVKMALAVLYPPATKLVDWTDQVLMLVAMVIQDLCVAAFSLVTVTALAHLLTPPQQAV